MLIGSSSAKDFKPSPEMRDELGKEVRAAWIEWAQSQPVVKPSWVVPYDELSEPDKEADRMIGERLYLRFLSAVEAECGDTVSAIIEGVF